MYHQKEVIIPAKDGDFKKVLKVMKKADPLIEREKMKLNLQYLNKRMEQHAKAITTGPLFHKAEKEFRDLQDLHSSASQQPFNAL